MSRAFFFADPHHNHEKIIKYCNRPFKDVIEMNKKLILNWNNTVSKHDKVFLLGDFAFGTVEQVIEIGQQLQGHKTLILGNHDKKSLEVYRRAGFEEVCRYPILWNDFYILSHAPKFITESSPYFNIFGHVHNDPAYKDYSSNSFCVSAERINYTPISFDEIRKRVGKFTNG